MLFLRQCVIVLLLLFTAKADFLNNYFNDKVFGIDPGPCPDQARQCEFHLDSTEFPPSIGNIEFCLFSILGFGLFCDEVKDWVQDGIVQIFELTCQDVVVTNVALTPFFQSFDTIKSTFDVDSARLSCNGRVRLIDVVLLGRLRIEVNALTEFTTDGNRRGVDLNFNLDLSASGGFENNLVDNADVNSCGFDVDLGIRVSNTNDFSIRVFGNTFGISILEDQIINLVLRIVEAAMGSIFCEILEQGGTLENGDDGILNVILNELNEEYDLLIAPVTIDPEAVDVALQQDPLSFGATQEELDLSLNLADSNGLELVSVTLNEFLGNPEVDPLRVNQAIELLTDPDGEFFLDLSGSETELSQTLPLNFADATFNLLSARIIGLNTIDSFKFLDNDFSEGGNGLDFTLKHEFSMKNFQFLFTIDTTFSRGEWVTESSCGSLPFNAGCTDDQESFTFDFGVTVDEIDFQAATLTAFNFAEIQELQIGQVFDKELTDILGAARSVLQCIAPAVFVFELSDLALSVQSIRDPVVDNFSGQGVDDLILNGFEIFNALSKNLIANDLPALMRGPIRKEINNFLRTDISDVDNFDNCPPYVQVPSLNPHIEFSTPPINAIFPVINDVLGDFSADSDVDLNDFVQQLGEYYAENAEDFPLEPGLSIGDWVTKSENIPLADFRAFEDAFQSPNDEAFIQLVDAKISNLDTIDRFFSEAASDQKPHGFSFEVGFLDEEVEALQIILGFHIFAEELQNNEKFDFIVEIQGIDFQIFIEELLVNQDSIFRLTYAQTTHIPCVQSVIDGFSADVERSSATAANIRFDIDFDPAFSSSSDMRTALETLDAEFTTSNERFTALSNYLFGIAFKSGLTELEKADFNLTPEDCLEIESDISFLLSLFVGFSTLEATFLRDECLQETPAVPPARITESQRIQDRGDEFFKWTENTLIDLLSGFLDVSSGNEAEDLGTIRNFLFTLANGEGNFIADIFKIDTDENGDESVTLEIPLNEANEILQLLNLQPFSFEDNNQFLVEVQFLRIKNIDRFLNDLRLFQTPGDFTLKHSIGFANDESLKVEIVALVQVNAEIVDGAPPGTPPIQERITIETDLSGITVDIEMLAAIKSTGFKELSVGHFLSISEDQVFTPADTALSCFLKNTEPGLFEITELKVDFSSIGKPVVSAEENQLISPGVELVIAEVTSLLAEFYADALPRITQSCIRDQANLALLESILLAESGCPAAAAFTEISEANSVLKFSDSLAYLEFQDFLVDVMYPNNFEVLNLFIEGITAERFFDTNPFSTGVMELSYDGVEYGGLEINITKLIIEGLNTMTLFEFFEPISREDQEFDEDTDPFTVKFAFNHSGPTTYQTTEVITGYDIFVQSDVVSNDIDLNFIFTNFSFALEVVLKVNLNTLLQVRFDQVDELNELPCILTPIEDIDVINFDIFVDDIEVTLDCNSVCDSPLLDRLTINGAFSSDNTEELAQVFQAGIAFAVGYLESSPAQTLIDVAVTNSEENCDALVDGIQTLVQTSSGDDIQVFFYLLYVCIGVIALLGISMLFQYPRHKTLLAMRIQEFQQDANKEFGMKDELDIFGNEMRALAWSPVVPLAIKIFTPILCIFNITVLTWAVTSQGAMTILITFTILEMEMVAIDLVPFTVVSTVDDIWNSGGWYLSIMIVAFSFLWPIVKNMALIYLWYTPTTVLKQDSRASWLEFLDVMGKWSFVDVFVVVMTLSALQTSIALSQQEDLTFLDENFFFTEVSMKPEIGIVMLSVVSALSLVANHIMTFFDRKTDAFYKSEYDRVSGNVTTPKRALQKKNIQKYKFAGRKTNSSRMNWIGIINVLSGFLTVCGVFLPIVRFEMRGIVGLLVEELDASQATREFSVFQLGAILFEAGPEGFDEQIVIALFVFLYFSVAIIGPFLQVIVLQVLLVKKFNLANLSTMIYVVMLVSFWTALDVVLIGIGATLLQITNVTDFIVNFITNDICSNVQDVIATFVPDEQDDSCLTVVGFWGIGAIPLLFGTISQLAVHGIVMVMATRMKQDWYYFAYVLYGHRKRESKPKRLSYFRNIVYKTFTLPSKRKSSEEDILSESSPTPRKSLVMKNPKFTSSPRQQMREPQYEEESEVSNPIVRPPRIEFDDRSAYSSIVKHPEVSAKLPPHAASTNGRGRKNYQGEYNHAAFHNADASTIPPPPFIEGLEDVDV